MSFVYIFTFMNTADTNYNPNPRLHYRYFTMTNNTIIYQADTKEVTHWRPYLSVSQQPNLYQRIGGFRFTPFRASFAE
jgi:hypothetical protein